MDYCPAFLRRFPQAQIVRAFESVCALPKALTKRKLEVSRMADLKLFHSQAVPQAPSRALSPYAHQLNTSGTACAEDCPACRWIERTADAPWRLKTQIGARRG